MKKARRQKIEGPPLRRSSEFRAEEAIIDQEARRVRVSFSSEFPVLRRNFLRGDWVEILGHDAQEVMLDRLNNGAPVLYNHDRSDSWAFRDTRIGVVERAWIEGNRGMAEIRLSRRSDVDGLWQDIRDGVLNSISVGYAIHERTLTKENGDQGADEYRVNRWEPLEISMVDIPADYSVGVGRSHENPTEFRIINLDKEGNIMPDEPNRPETREQPATPPPVTTSPAQPPVDREAIIEEARQAERKRRQEIRGVFEPFPAATEARDECLDDPDVTVDDARKHLLDWLGRDSRPAVDRNHRIDVGLTDREKFRRAAEDWLSVRANLKDSKLDRQNEINGYSLREVLRRSLELAGISTRGLDEAQMLQRAISHGASDFPAITENLANKAMMQGFMDAPETYQTWTQVGSLSDFKIASRIDRGGFNSLREVKRGAEFKFISTEDRKEQIQLVTFGEMFGIDRQTIIDDDVGAFTAIPAEIGVAGRGTVGDLVYGILTGNPAMSDGVTLFHANHNNLPATATITTASVDAMRTLMATQKRPGVTDRSANIMLSYLLVPVALQGAALVVRDSQFEVGPTNRNNTTPNTERGRFEVVADSRLDDASTSVWYGAAGRRTIEVAYLNGRQEPTIERMDGWNVLGVTWRVYFDVAAKALDWRTLAKNA